MDDLDARRTNKRLIGALFLMGFLFAGAVLFGIYYFTRGECPYNDLETCLKVNENKCGTSLSLSSGDCYDYVNFREPCFCSKCRFCMNELELQNCAMNREDRNKSCLKLMETLGK